MIVTEGPRGLWFGGGQGQGLLVDVEVLGWGDKAGYCPKGWGPMVLGEV